jgi:lysophospholipase L1-like esterase
MVSPVCPSSILRLICLVLFANTALGQSISMVRKGGNQFWIEAASPPDTQYVLQTSENLHLWVDLNEDVWGRFSYSFTNAGVKKRFFRLVPWTSVPSIRLVLIGDCTVMDGSGWGSGIPGYMKSIVRVVNLGYSWQSTKVFLASEEMGKMMVIKPDYVFIQFGLMDATVCGGVPDRCQTTLQEYASNLATIILTIRGWNGNPILVTPPVRRGFEQGQVDRNWLSGHCAAMKSVATELQTPLVDLNRLSADLFEELGPDGSAFITWDDNLHFSAAGAKVLARLIVNNLPDYLGPYLANIFDQPSNP